MGEWGCERKSTVTMSIDYILAFLRACFLTIPSCVISDNAMSYDPPVHALAVLHQVGLGGGHQGTVQRFPGFVRFGRRLVAGP